MNRKKKEPPNKPNHDTPETTTPTPSKGKTRPRKNAAKEPATVRRSRVYREQTPIVIRVDEAEFEDWRIGRRVVAYMSHGEQYNETNCTRGRDVEFSIGNGKAPRLSALILNYSTLSGEKLKFIPEVQRPDPMPTKIAAITITGVRPLA